MVLLEVHSKCLKDKYKTTILSKTTLFVLLTNVAKVIIPFVLAYRSRGLWLKRDVFYEQPDITFRGEYIFTAFTKDLSNPIVCTTLPEYYKETSSFDTCSVVKVREIDNNLDGKMDEFYMSLVVNTPENIISMTVIILIDYKLHAVCPLLMQSAIILQQYINLPITKLDVNGDLSLTQMSTIYCHHRFENRDFNRSLVVDTHDANSYEVENILSEYRKRNISTHLTNLYTSFGMEDQALFTLNLHVRYPEHKIYYKPGLSQLLKWAWIQYISIYIVFAWIINKIEKYVFDKRLVLFYTQNAIKEKTR